MKKKMVMVLVLAMLSVTACGNKETSVDGSMAPETTVTAPTEEGALASASSSAASGTQQATAQPEVTRQPTATVEPEITAQPVSTDKAETAQPEVTRQPTATVKPEITAQPVSTDKLEASQSAAAPTTEQKQPTATSKPAETSKPAATAKPTVTSKPTETPKEETGAQSTPAPAHTCSWDKGTVTREAACNAEGEMTYSCSCGKSYTESIPRTSHSYVAQTTEPTCTEPGGTTEVCSICGDTKGGSSTIAALGHSYSKSYPMGNDTSCRGGSYYVVTCSRCGDFSEDGHDDALPCDYEAVEVVTGTCSDPSVIEYTCKNCGHSYRDIGSTTDDHNWVTKQDVPTVDMETGLFIPGEEITYCSECNARK